MLHGNLIIYALAELCAFLTFNFELFGLQSLIINSKGFDDPEVPKLSLLDDLG